jgi:hypothetical protein
MQRSNLRRKGLIFAIIFFMIFINFIQTPGKNIINNTALKYPENSILCGYTTDHVTGEGLEGTCINFFIEDSQGNDYDYEAWTDENGFYLIENVSAGWCIEYGAWADGYHFYWMFDFYIGENETVWVNMSMLPLQPETITLCGYITDDLTGEPIFNVTVIAHWIDIWHRLNYRGTQSNENGFYLFTVGEGRSGIYTDHEAYMSNWTGWPYLEGNETIWTNLSLTPELIVEIMKPDDGIYYGNKKILPFSFPIIIGPIDIQIRVTLNDGNPIDHVRILIDGEEKANSSSWPYSYYWDYRTPFKIYHEIEVTAGRRWDSDTTERLQVLKFF